MSGDRGSALNGGVPETVGGHVRRTHQRLLVEASIEEGYSVRLEQRLIAGRTSSRITRPVRLEFLDGEATGGEVLVTRTQDYGEARFALDEVYSVSLVTTRLRPEEEHRGGLSVGEPVLDPHWGVGVVQAFRDEGDDEFVVVRFDVHGSQWLPLAAAELRSIGQSGGRTP